jgi:hypothetical protein
MAPTTVSARPSKSRSKKRTPPTRPTRRRRRLSKPVLGQPRRPRRDDGLAHTGGDLSARAELRGRIRPLAVVGARRKQLAALAQPVELGAVDAESRGDPRSRQGCGYEVVHPTLLCMKWRGARLRRAPRGDQAGIGLRPTRSTKPRSARTSKAVKSAPKMSLRRIVGFLCRRGERLAGGDVGGSVTEQLPERRSGRERDPLNDRRWAAIGSSPRIASADWHR